MPPITDERDTHLTHDTNRERLFELTESAFGYYPSRKMLKRLLKDGNKTASKIRKLALETIYEEVEHQTSITGRIKPGDSDDTVKRVNADFMYAALMTSQKFRVFSEMEALWQSLCEGESPEEAAISLRRFGSLDGD